MDKLKVLHEQNRGITCSYTIMKGSMDKLKVLHGQNRGITC